MQPRNFDYLCDLVRTRTGIELDAMEYLLEPRLQLLCKSEGLDSIEQLFFVLRTQADTDFKDRVAEAFTTNETSFFRDARPFEVLSSSVLPEIFERTNGGVNIWSSGCSSGQEAYSIAILIREQFPEAQKRWIRILASDVSPTMIKRASDGVYTEHQINRGLDAEFRDKYFDKEGISWRVNHDLASMVDFRVINLTALPRTLPRIDVVFLRNVLLYLSDDWRSKILTQIHDIMSPSGYLFLGAPETSVPDSRQFERIVENNTVYFRARNRPIASNR